jgi:hypothetical protein
MYIFLFLTSLAFATGWDIRSVRESTYSRDNTYCQIGLQRIEFQIRSDASHTDSNDKKYGTYLFFYPNELPKLLPLNKDKMHSFRFFHGNSSLCSKSLGYSIGKDKIAVLFLKENRPDMDKLSFQIMNATTFEPENIIDTEYMSDLTEIASGGFVFRTHDQRNGLEMGKTKIKDLEYLFQDRDFPYWVKYSEKGFKISALTSFQKFPWKGYFKDVKDFFAYSGWDRKEKKFKNATLYVAVNHALKKECILLSPAKIKITEAETGWRCN